MGKCTHCANYNVQKALRRSSLTVITILCEDVCMQLAV
jgi:hypothetical protein